MHLHTIIFSVRHSCVRNSLHKWQSAEKALTLIPLVSSHWLFSAAEWGQALLYSNKKEPVHRQEHKGHLPGLHRETGLYWQLLTNFFIIATQ